MTRKTQTEIDRTQDSRCAHGADCGAFGALDAPEATEPSLSRRSLIRAGAAAGALGSAAWFSGRAGRSRARRSPLPGARPASAIRPFPWRWSAAFSSATAWTWNC